MKPIWYYVNVPEGHEDYEGLQVLETIYGSYFERMPTRNLFDMMVRCVRCGETPMSTTVQSSTIGYQTMFDLIPFLHLLS